MKKLKFRIIILTAFCLSNVVIFAQNNIGLTVKNVQAPPQYFSHFLGKKTQPNVEKLKPNAPKPATMPIVFSAENLPFFCKIEHKLMQKQNLPFKFRLGDVQYVEEMEGKGKKTNH